MPAEYPSVVADNARIAALEFQTQKLVFITKSRMNDEIFRTRPPSVDRPTSVQNVAEHVVTTRNITKSNSSMRVMCHGVRLVRLANNVVVRKAIATTIHFSRQIFN